MWRLPAVVWSGVSRGAGSKGGALWCVSVRVTRSCNGRNERLERPDFNRVHFQSDSGKRRKSVLP